MIQKACDIQPVYFLFHAIFQKPLDTNTRDIQPNPEPAGELQHAEKRAERALVEMFVALETDP